MEKLSLLDIILNKDEQNETHDRGDRFFAREFSVSITKKIKRLLSRGFFRFAHSFSYFLSHVSAKSYGSAILAFGLLSTIMYFLGFSFDEGIATPIIGIAFACFAIPFLLTDKPLPIMLQDFEPTDYLFFEFFCMKRHTVLEAERRLPVFVAIIIGAIPATLSTVIPLWMIALIIGILVCVYIGIESPEFLFLASLAFLPFMTLVPHSGTILAATLVLAVISFMVKFLYGKRVLFIEQYDVFIGAMMFFILISGIFVKGIESFSGSVRMIIFVFGYTIAGNVITNRRLADRAANSIIIPGAIAALVSIVQLITLVFHIEGELTPSSLDFLLARQDGLAVCFLASIVFAVGMIGGASSVARAIYVISACLSTFALIISGEIFAVIALILGILVYQIIKHNKLSWLLLPILLILPLSILLLPNNILNAIFEYSPSISSAEELFSLWRHSLEVFLENIFVGIGIGRESFIQEMADLGVSGYADSSNLFIELGLEAGVFALLSFIMVVITRLRHRSLRYIYVRNSQIETLSAVSGVALFCILAFGIVNYIWSAVSSYYLFWCILGMGSATLRVAKRDYDDKVLYYEETSDSDSSVIDIEIG